MKLRNVRVWLPSLQIGLASVLLFLGRAESAAHQIELGRANVVDQFDYYPAAVRWLAALYAPSGLMTLPVAAIPRIPKMAVAIWFVLCVGAFWYWLASQFATRTDMKRSQVPRRSFWGELFNWLGLFFGLTLCLTSVSAALHGGLPLVVDICGFIWGLGVLIIFGRNIGKLRPSSQPARLAP